MGLIDTLKSVFIRSGKKIQKRNNDFLSSMTGRGSNSGIILTDETAFNFTAVWSAIRILSDLI